MLVWGVLVWAEPVTTSPWAVSEAPTGRVVSGSLLGGRFRYSDLKEAARPSGIYAI